MGQSMRFFQSRATMSQVKLACAIVVFQSALAASNPKCGQASAGTESATSVISIAQSASNAFSSSAPPAPGKTSIESQQCFCPCSCPNQGQTGQPGGFGSQGGFQFSPYPPRPNQPAPKVINQPAPKNNNQPAPQNSGNPGNSYCSSVSSWSQADAAKEDKMIQLVNQARASGRSCGSRGYFPAVGPVTFNANLRCSARKHAQDMAQRNYFSHNSLGSGEEPSSRITQAGYSWRTNGENIAAGYADPDATSDQWLKSDGHCANIMNGNFKELGVGYSPNDSSTYKSYWVENFGAQ